MDKNFREAHDATSSSPITVVKNKDYFIHRTPTGLRNTSSIGKSIMYTLLEMHIDSLRPVEH